MRQALISQNCKKGSSIVENNGRYWALSNILDGPIASAIYANSLWVARSEISKTGELYHSKDGKSWSTVTLSDMQLNFVTHANGLWLAGGYDGMYYSTDGKTWTQTGCPCLAMGQTSCANGVWLRTGYTIMPKDATGIGVFYSTDGKNWNQADFPLVEQYERIEFNPSALANVDGLWVMLDQYEGLYYSTLTRQISKSA